MTRNVSKFEQLRNWFLTTFPPRQIFLRSEGRVRFLTISPVAQVTMLVGLMTLMGWAALTSFTYLTQDALIREHKSAMNGMENRYDQLENGYRTLEDDLAERAARLEARQRFLEDVLSDQMTLPETSADTPQNTEATSAAPAQAEQTSALPPASLFDADTADREALATPLDRRSHFAAKLAHLEEGQRRLAAAMLEDKQQRLDAIDTALKRTKLTSEDLASAWTGDEVGGVGGPFVPAEGFAPVFSAADVKPFEKLLTLWEQLELVKGALESVPVGKPAADYYVSSRFGPRIDPLKKVRANHPGLDLAAWPGTAILATAPGTIVHASWYGPYGNMVEIEHGNGFRTRYGHMRRLRVKVGDEVETGHRIGDMGKTGRVTDTHLHYEVWFKGKVIDPAPFLKVTDDVREIRAGYEKTGS